MKILAILLLAVLISTPTMAQLDSVDVHLEKDPDGDGIYQIQYSYRERAGVWGVPSSGKERVMFEVAQDTMVTIWYETDYKQLQEIGPDERVVDVDMFLQFFESYGTPMDSFTDGTKRFKSPDGMWTYVPDTDSLTVP